MMDLFTSAAGTVTLELTGATLTDSLTHLTNLGITILDVKILDELTARFRILRCDYRKVSKFSKQRGDNLRILRQEGMYWSAKRLLKRPLLLGALLLICGCMLLPKFILFVEVEGNRTIPARLILESAAQCGIRFGASAREVRSEKMKNALLSEIPQLQWAGVNTNGCVAVITVRERNSSETEVESREISNIIASRDGIILSCTVTAGNGLFTPGQAVRKGDMLICGYTDYGLCVTATRAEGEIFALTDRTISAKIPSDMVKRDKTTAQFSKISLQIGKNRINFAQGSGIYDASCVKMYSKYVLTLPGGFRLPVTLVRETIINCNTQETEFSETDAGALLTEFASRYLQQQMIAGTILRREEQLRTEYGSYLLTGNYACTEMIGQRQKEQNGVIP